MHSLWACQHLAYQSPGYKGKSNEALASLSYPDKINWQQFSGDCQVMMAEGGEKCNENVVHEDLVVKRNSTEYVLIVWVCMYVCMYVGMYQGDSRKNKCTPMIMLLNSWGN